MRLLEGGVVNDRVRIEDHHVGKVAGCEAAAPLQLEVGGRQRGQLPDGFFQRDDVLLADVFPQQPGHVTIRARMRASLEKHTLSGVTPCIRSEAHPRQRNLLLHVVLRHREEDAAHTAVVLHDEVHRRFFG